MAHQIDTTADNWHLYVDTGGTFTDCLARDPKGTEHRVKVLSSSALRGRLTCRVTDRELVITAPWSGQPSLVLGFDFRLLNAEHPRRRVVAYDPRTRTLTLDGDLPDTGATGVAFEVISPEPAPLLAARVITETGATASLEHVNLRLATTRGTNALLTRSGAPPVLIINRGFGDLLIIGTQARPDLFALAITKPEPLYEKVVEIDGRLTADGTPLSPIDVEAIDTLAADLIAKGHRVAAVALLHADKNPDHEKLVADRLLAAGFTHVSRSSALAPMIKLGLRAETAVVDAYLSPVIQAYLDGIAAAIKAGALFVMTSAGGLVGAQSFRAKDSLLSGPAGGIAGAALVGRQCGFERLIAFDMGGTSTDVARFDGDFEYVFEHAVGDAHLVAPALSIESVAAGGGSICTYDGIRLRVGPDSASAFPGPACYAAGGPLTITDVNLLLGRIDGSRFEIPIETSAATQALTQVKQALAAQTGERATDEALLEGFLELCNQRMADAIRRISLRVGYDPQHYALVAFGGAGPQHAVSVADRLGVQRVIIPDHPGLLSTKGLEVAVIERFAERQVLAPLSQVEGTLGQLFEQLDRSAVDALVSEGVPRKKAIPRRRIASMRYSGQDATLEVDAGGPDELKSAFEQRYEAVFGHRPADRAIEVVSLRAVASTPAGAVTDGFPAEQAHTPTPDSTVRARFGGQWREVPVYEREQLAPGDRFDGPCLVFERYSAAVIEPEWQVVVDGSRHLIVHKIERQQRAEAVRRPQAVLVELYTHRFETMAKEMGEALRRTAISTNIKERLDFSCAVLDAHGELIVNAPHIPVHLGSLGMCVRELSAIHNWRPGDTMITNHPRFGGSHLPDVTLVSPVFDTNETLLGYVASRAHHAEIGGVRPGSMPPGATSLAEEGVVIPPTLLVRQGQARWATIESLLTGQPYPTRSLADNLADLRAALAANTSGVAALRQLADEQGSEAVSHHMQLLKDRAESAVRRALSTLDDGSLCAEEVLDDGSVIDVALTIAGDRASLTLGSRERVHPGNLNATPAIVRSAVLYVLRLLLAEPLPLNEGLLRAIAIDVQPGMLNPPFPDDPSRAPAVVGGNVETSQRLVNALVRLLGLAAASQGTMNNVLFGNDRQSYYETICGGCGAGPAFDGASAVHSHMTNTRITDPEVIEHRYDVRVERFAVRRGSGGSGRFRGGDGVVREIRFLAPMALSVLSQHRTCGPPGLAGGEPGAAGRQQVVRADGQVVALGSSDACQVEQADRLIIETPGGGGYGRPNGKHR